MSGLDEIRARLTQSELLGDEALTEHIDSWRQAATNPEDGDALVNWLVERQLLTEFQAEAILAGHSGPFMLGPYRVSEQVTTGLLGNVFRASHVEFDQRVSLKVFPPVQDAAQEARVGRELRIAISVDNPHVVRTFQVGRAGEACYLALEPLEGESLQTRLERDGRLPFRDACRLVRDVARGLEHLHANDIIHRDLRPHNIWITPSGAPKILEFGAARDALAYLDSDEEAVEGRESEEFDDRAISAEQYEYMAPEQAHDIRKADAQSDIYALGCVLYACLTGRPPFVNRNPVKLVLEHVFDTPAPVEQLADDVPHQLNDTIRGMMARDAKKRFAKAGDVAWALAQYIGEEEAPAEQVAVVDVSPEYLQWVQSQAPAEPKNLATEAVATTPELVGFLGWMTKREAKAKKKR